MKCLELIRAWQNALKGDNPLLWSGVAILCGSIADDIFDKHQESDTGQEIRFLSELAWVHYTGDGKNG